MHSTSPAGHEAIPSPQEFEGARTSKEGKVKAGKGAILRNPPIDPAYMQLPRRFLGGTRLDWTRLKIAPCHLSAACNLAGSRLSVVTLASFSDRLRAGDLI